VYEIKNNVIFDQVVTQRNISLLFSGGRDSDHYDALLPAEEEEKLCIFEEVCIASLTKPLSLVSSAA
jgi:hypothetical protein